MPRAGGSYVGTFKTDVTSDDDVEELVETATSEYGGLDIAFNNAGIGGTFEATEEISEENWHVSVSYNGSQ
ncbi:SDR family oxidoreductase [Saliphagus infecundisoli]|uniref:SDR family oxidoreductase n=1 Tax=Saliphagus infecundisoli TaxID=1849069 RepID=A0ABD5QC74_9EURY